MNASNSYRAQFSRGAEIMCQTTKHVYTHAWAVWYSDKPNDFEYHFAPSAEDAHKRAEAHVRKCARNDVDTFGKEVVSVITQ